MAQNKKDQHQAADADLVTRCLAGNKVAFAALIDRHRPRLERLLRAILDDWLEIEDVWQETVLRVYLNLEQLRDPARFGAWICSIAINLARTRRNTAFSGVYYSWETLNNRDTNGSGWPDHKQPSPEAVIVRQELANRVRQAIVDLPPAEREAVMLVYLNELSHKEAATQLGSSLGAVKVRVHRGRHRLRAALQNEFGLTTQQKIKERKMIKVKVHDVMMIVRPTNTSAKNEATRPQPGLLDILYPNRPVLLKEDAGDRAIAIWIDFCESRWIVHHLKQQQTKRPITYDLTNTLLNLGQVEVGRVVVNRLHEETFYGNLIVKTGSTESEVDCRPSDAINLALRLDAPMFVASEIMAQEGFTPSTDGGYDWAEYCRLRMRTPDKYRDLFSKLQDWNWQSVLDMDIAQLVKEHLGIDDDWFKTSA